MTKADAIEYLISQSTGVEAPQLNNLAQVAFETAYNEVWGCYRWVTRRVETTLTLTASGPTTNLPVDFERAIWMSLHETGNKHRIPIKPEEWFDMHYPYPADDSNGEPTVCKIVYSPSAPASQWKAYWWRVPDSAYSVILSYDRKANSGNFDNLPSHMIKPILVGALALVKGNINERGGFDQLFEKALARAQMADKTTSGVLPLYGPDYGWDDFGSGGGNSGDTNDPLDFYG